MSVIVTPVPVTVPAGVSVAAAAALLMLVSLTGSTVFLLSDACPDDRQACKPSEVELPPVKWGDEPADQFPTLLLERWMRRAPPVGSRVKGILKSRLQAPDRGHGPFGVRPEEEQHCAHTLGAATHVAASGKGSWVMEPQGPNVALLVAACGVGYRLGSQV